MKQLGEFVVVEGKKSGIGTGALAAWVKTLDYAGPNRRRANSLFKRRKQRLDDLGASTDLAGSESLETLLRRVRLWTDLSHASTEQRAFLVAALEAVERKAGAEPCGQLAGATARYIRGVGAAGRLDAELITDAIAAAGEAMSEGEDVAISASLFARLENAPLVR